MIHRVVEVRALPNFRIWVRFEDGASGQVDLVDVAGKGVFAYWDEPGAFERVFVDEESGTVAWPGGIDLAPDTLYREVTGLKAG